MLDEAAFTSLTAAHRHELHVHSYRMLGNFEQAEDAVQEALLRAWRGRATFDGGPGARAWLYRIVTTTCIDLIRQSGRQVRQLTSFAEVPWLQPYPDALLDRAADDAEQPERAVIARETIELAYLAVIQLLPARQRAVLLLRDVQGYSAADTAAILDLTVPAANSARCSGPGRRCVNEPPSGTRTGRRRRSPTATCSRPSSTPTPGRTPRPRSPCSARTSVCPCRPSRCSTRVAPRSPS